MAAIITDTFDYDDIVRVLDLDEAFVFHQVKALQSFITYDMLRGEQVEKGESQSKAAIVQEEEGFKTYEEIIYKLLKYGVHI